MASSTTAQQQSSPARNKTRRNTAIVAGALYLVTVPFLILVLIGNIRDAPVLRDTWFFRLDVSQVIPISVENSQLLNSVARSLGLHDFYQVGLWNFCEGYLDEGITYCSKPETLYWFNPVAVLVSELLAGAQIALPAQLLTVLTLLRIGQRVTFAFFLAGLPLNVLLLLATPLAIRGRRWSLPLSLFAFLAAVLVTVAAIIATAISVAFRIAATAQDQLNIRSDIGVQMFVFMWIGAVATDLAFLLHSAMGCCCRNPRSTASSSAVSPSGQASPVTEKKKRSDEKRSPLQLPSFVRRRKGAAGASS